MKNVLTLIYLLSAFSINAKCYKPYLANEKTFFVEKKCFDAIIQGESVLSERDSIYPLRPTAEPALTKEKLDNIYSVAEVMPSFVGGNNLMNDFINKNLKYPEEAKNSTIQGAVFVGFVVEKDGSLSNIVIKRGLPGGCSEEALRVIRLMPKWNPGKLQGVPVRVSYILPVRFK